MPVSNHLLLRACVLCLPFSFASADITSWRNDSGGKFPSANPPIEWSDNTVWKTPLDAKSNATPILVDDKLFFTSEPANLICADATTGEILWTRSNSYLDLLDLSAAQVAEAEAGAEKERELGTQIGKLWNDHNRIDRRAKRDGTENTSEVATAKQAKRDEINDLEKQKTDLANDPNIGSTILPPKHDVNGYTSYSPISDGEFVYVSFGLGVVTAYDFNGNRQWFAILDKPDHGWGGSTMPLLVDDKLVVRFTDYVALDAKTGKEVWRTPSGTVFGTPTLFQVEDQSFLFTPLGAVIRAANGEVIQDGLVRLHARHPWSVFNTPVLEGNKLYSVRGFKYEGEEGFASAFQIPDTIAKLESTGIEVIWRADVFKDRYYASSIVNKGLMYALSRTYMFTVLDADTGELVYEEQITGLRGTAYPSISLAGNHLIFASDEGAIVVVEQGRKYNEVSRSQLEPFRSTPIFEGDIAYIRTFDHLQAYRAN